MKEALEDIISHEFEMDLTSELYPPNHVIEYFCPAFTEEGVLVK